MATIIECYTASFHPSELPPDSGRNDGYTAVQLSFGSAQIESALAPAITPERPPHDWPPPIDRRFEGDEVATGFRWSGSAGTRLTREEARQCSPHRLRRRGRISGRFTGPAVP